MRAYTALFLIATLLVSSYATAVEKHHETLKQLEKSEFGRNLLSTIEVSLKSKEPVDNILSLLNEIDEDLEREAEAADALHTDFQERCDNDLESIRDELEVANVAKEDATEVLDTAVPKYQQLTEEQERVQGEVDDVTDQLLDLANARNEEAEAYENGIREIEDALAVFAEARRVVERVAEDLPEEDTATLETNDEGEIEVPEPAGEDAQADEEEEEEEVLIQKKSKLGVKKIAGEAMHSLAQLLKRTELKRHGVQHFATMLSALKTEIYSNPQLVYRVLDLLDSMSELLNNAAVNERHAEEIRIDVYNANIGQLRGVQTALQAQLDNLNYEMHTVDQQIVYSQNKLDEANRTIDEKQSQFEDREQECHDEATNYDAESERRSNERDVIREVEGVINERLASLQEYIKDRVAAQLD